MKLFGHLSVLLFAFSSSKPADHDEQQQRRRVQEMIDRQHARQAAAPPVAPLVDDSLVKKHAHDAAQQRKVQAMIDRYHHHERSTNTMKQQDDTTVSPHEMATPLVDDSVGKAVPKEGSVEAAAATPLSPTLLDISVCTSPGCVADGAASTLARLRALAPAHVRVHAGSCASRCGNGPVVTVGDKVHRNIKADQVAALLREILPDQQLLPSPALVQGYDTALQADQAFAAQHYDEAQALYQNAYDLAFSPAMTMQTARAKLWHHADVSSLDWLVRVRRQQARALLQLHRMADAVLVAQSSCNISRNTNVASFVVLATVYRHKQDVANEHATLATVLSLWKKDTNDALTQAQRNERREHQLRHASLTRQLPINHAK